MNPKKTTLIILAMLPAACLAAILDGPQLTPNSVTSARIKDGAILGVDISTTTNIRIDTMTITGNAFSVGISTLSVSGGKVGIGTTSPSEQLEVAQNVVVGGSTTASAFFGDGNKLTDIRPFFEGKNKEGSTINRCDAVYISGGSGSVINIKKAKGDSDTTAHVAGLITSDNCLSDTICEVTALGLAKDCNTTAFLVGDILHLSVVTAGELQVGHITGPGFDFIVGTVQRVDVNKGTIFVSPHSHLTVGLGFANQIRAMLGDATAETYKNLNGTSAEVEISQTDSAITIGFPDSVTITSTLTVAGNAFSVGGSTLAVSNGRVGIGTTSPAQKLHLESTSGGVFFDVRGDGDSGVTIRSFTPSGTAGLFFRRSRGTQASPTAVQINDQLSLIGTRGMDDLGSFGSRVVNIRALAEENFTSTNRGARIEWEVTPIGSTSASEAMRLTGSGNLGIGTDSPGKKLEVADQILSKANGFSGLQAQTFSDTSGTFPGLFLRRSRGTISSPAAVVLDDPIGLINARGMDDLASFGSSVAGITFSAAENFTSTNRGTRIEWSVTPIGGTSSSEVMRLTGAGNLGIGTTSPSRPLHIVNASDLLARFESTDSFSGISLRDNSTTAGDQVIVAAVGDAMKLRTLNTDRIVITSAGNVGIGTAIPATSALLDIVSTTKGLLIPRVTTAQKDAISSPAIGLQVFDTSKETKVVNTTIGWKDMGAGWYKFTFNHTAFQTAALNNDIELFSLPAGGTIERVFIKHSIAFAGTGITAYTMSVGIVGNLAKYASAFDVFQAAGNTIFQFSNGGFIENFGVATSVRIAATSVGANLDQSTAGDVEVWMQTSVLQ